MTTITTDEYFGLAAGKSNFVPANHERWSVIGWWTADEATALSFDLEPQSVGTRLIDPWGRQYKMLRDLIRWAQTNGELPVVLEPLAYIRWAEDKGVQFPAPLKQMLVKASKIKRKLHTVQRGPADCESRNLLELLGGLMRAYYNLKPRMSRSGDAANIRGELDRVGVTMNTDTVRKWKRKALSTTSERSSFSQLATREKGTLYKLIWGLIASQFGAEWTTDGCVPGEVYKDLSKAGTHMGLGSIQEALHKAAEARI